MISVNDGHGLSTYLGAFADLLSELELFKFSSYAKTAEGSLGQPEQGKSLFDEVLLYFQGSNKGRVWCIDISEWMTKLGDREFRDFLREIDEHIGENIIFFRVPFVEQNVLRDIEKGIREILTVTTVAIPPFSNDELIRCAETILSERGYSVEDDAWEVFGSISPRKRASAHFAGYIPSGKPSARCSIRSSSAISKIKRAARSSENPTSFRLRTPHAA